MTSFKIFFSENNIRRIRVSEIPSYEEFTNLIQDLYPKFHVELCVKYIDSDGDKISLDSQIEWEEMLMEFGGQSCIKLLVEEGDGGYFKDGPNPEVLKFYYDKTTKEAVDVATEWMATLQEKVPEFLSSLFKDGKIIPTHIPSFLKEAMTMKYVENNIVDLDINIHMLFDSLHAKAVQLLNSVNPKDIEQGRDYLIATLTLIPDNCVALYNLACAESLLGNAKAALANLEKAIDYGFRNLSHMLQDADFTYIRETETFQILVAKLESLMDYESQQNCDNETPEPTVIPEPIVELIIPEPEPQVDLSASILPLQENYGEELTLLSEMGFSADKDVLLLLLDQFNGSINDVAQFLLGFNQ